MKTNNIVPDKNYGVLDQIVSTTDTDEAIEQIRSIGYAVVQSGLTAEDLIIFKNEFDRAHTCYIEKYGKEFLEDRDEQNTIRLPLLSESKRFIEISTNPNVLAVIGQLIKGKFILNQQNAIINPPREQYNQGAWHRDLPYQHFVSSDPIAINALFCLDDFSKENGATFVIPASHKTGSFPSEKYIKNNAIQVEAKAGSFIVLDCMLYHAGGYNRTLEKRRAINHIYNIPFLKQQIQIPGNIDPNTLSSLQKDIFGFSYSEPKTVEDFLLSRKSK
ncbi:phytanoyl-CoA dioxygenase family protein [Pseudomonas sp. NA-150]|uniref:phytanoyl-CoA dioxygenase family protein n=1 Tax=Pseudomonas sp. NA-150 TaxID=3367525 RepID=UPI0037CAC495